MRILHLLSQRPDATGSGIYLQAMVREAAARGMSNYLVAGAGGDWGGSIDWLPANHSLLVRFDQADLPFPIPGMSDVMPYASSRFGELTDDELLKYETAFTAAIRRAVNQFQPDIIHSHHLWIVSALARRLFPDLPLVTSCHGSDLRQFQNCPHLRARMLAGCRQIDMILALSAAQQDDITRLYGIPPEKVRIAGAGFNHQLFYPGTKPAGATVQLVYAGKLSNAKGVPYLLRALQTLATPAWQLHLVGGGSGAEHAQCLSLAEKLGDQVMVHGAVPQNDLARIVRQAHILILPSFFEGLPLVILEGLASGCRIVATDLPGIRAILGANPSGLITLVPSPRLRFSDQPYSADEAAFERNLNRAIHQQINAVRQAPLIDLSEIQDRIDRFKWSGVFKSVVRAYRMALAGRKDFSVNRSGDL